MDPIQELRNQFSAEINALQAEITDLKQLLAKASKQYHLKPSLPDPEKFSSITYKFNTWLPSMKAKLYIDSKAIGNDLAQFYYVYVNLDSSVQTMVIPQLLQAKEAKQWDYNTILNQLL